MQFRNPSYYSQYASRLEKNLLKKCAKRVDATCIHDLEMASRHGLKTEIRRKKVISVAFSMIYYLFPIARRLVIRVSLLKSLLLMKKYLDETIEQVGKLDDEQLEAILRLIREARELGAKFGKNLIASLQREYIGRIASKQVQEDLEKGESQTVEFKSQFPKNAVEMAKVIASFATSNAGRIFLGVNDKGIICGLDTKVSSVDHIKNRISNLSHQSIDPPVEINVEFWEFESKTFAVIEVPKGSEPVYFVNGSPYIRVLTSSRKATTSQVKELYRRYFARAK